MPAGTPNDGSIADSESGNSPDGGNMKIEEKIARAYHHDLSWRKVLVRLEPDAHNNMVVRRMFANAYGWPVVKHLCDTHFAYTAATQIPDDQGENEDRAKASDVSVGEDGEEVYRQTQLPDEPIPETDTKWRARNLSPCHADDNANRLPERMQNPEVRITPPKGTQSEVQESTDEVKDIVSPVAANATAASSYFILKKNSAPRLSRQDSAKWSDRFFEGPEGDSDDEDYLASIGRDGNRIVPRPINASAAQPEIADTLTQSPKESTVSSPTMPELEPLEYGKVGDVPTLSRGGPLSLTNIGLSRRPEERTTPAQEGIGSRETGRKAQPSLGVVERTAIAQAKKIEGRHQGWDIVEG
jgi:hypothetical protein